MPKSGYKFKNFIEFGAKTKRRKMEKEGIKSNKCEVEDKTNRKIDLLSFAIISSCVLIVCIIIIIDIITDIIKGKNIILFCIFLFILILFYVFFLNLWRKN